MRGRNIDYALLAVNLLTIVLLTNILTIDIPWLRTVLGLPFVFFFPGYVLISAIFPTRGSLNRLNRIALSFGLSVGVVIFVGLLLNYTPWGIGLLPILFSLAIFIFVLSMIAWYLRGRINQDRKSRTDTGQSIEELGDSFVRGGRLYIAVIIILCLSIIGFSGVIGSLFARPLVTQPFTEFYLLGATGQAEDYPLELRAGEEGKVLIGIVNREQKTVTYSLAVVMNGQEMPELPPIQLQSGEQWQGTVGFTPEYTGENQKVEFRLEKSNDQPFELRYLMVNVRT
jgi:uncharacterized membrane protein